MKKALVVLGPTATGKTDLALSLAKKFSGELVACDSRQVYKGLDIGTGKMPGRDAKVKKGQGFWDVSGVKIWMYDAADPKKQYTVKDYVEQAERVVEDILERGKLPIIVGGTGLYLKALLEGLPNLGIPVDQRLRGELKKLSVGKLQERLRTLSPARWQELNESDRQNPRRLLRSIEIIYMNPYTSKSQILNLKSQKYKTLKIGLTAPREFLKMRIYRRLSARLDQGMIEEVKRLYREGLSYQRMEELGLEYGLLAGLLQGDIKENQLVDRLSVKIYHYAKRQMTWFKKGKDICWFDISRSGWQDQVERKVASWYHLGNDKKD